MSSEHEILKEVFRLKEKNTRWKLVLRKKRIQKNVFLKAHNNVIFLNLYNQIQNKNVLFFPLYCFQP